MRQFEYHKLAEEVGRRGSYTVSPPPRSDAKYYCALQAARLMGNFTDTPREFFSQYEGLEREVERMVAAYPEGVPSDDVAIQYLDLMDHFLKKGDSGGRTPCRCEAANRRSDPGYRRQMEWA